MIKLKKKLRTIGGIIEDPAKYEEFFSRKMAGLLISEEIKNQSTTLTRSINKNIIVVHSIELLEEV